MNNGSPLTGGVPLNQPRGTPIIHNLIIMPNMVAVRDGVLLDPGSPKHLTVVDPLNATAWHVPLNPRQINDLLEALQ